MRPAWLIPIIAIGAACYVVWIVVVGVSTILGGIHA